MTTELNSIVLNLNKFIKCIPFVILFRKMPFSKINWTQGYMDYAFRHTIRRYWKKFLNARMISKLLVWSKGLGLGENNFFLRYLDFSIVFYWFFLVSVSSCYRKQSYLFKSCSVKNCPWFMHLILIIYLIIYTYLMYSEVVKWLRYGFGVRTILVLWFCQLRSV